MIQAARTTTPTAPRAATPDVPRRYLRPAQIAQYTGASRSLVFEWLKAGRETRGARGLWPQYRPSAAVVTVRIEDVDRWMEKLATP